VTPLRLASKPWKGTAGGTAEETLQGLDRSSAPTHTRSVRTAAWTSALAVALAGSALAPLAAKATFPGRNGRIAYTEVFGEGSSVFTKFTLHAVTPAGRRDRSLGDGEKAAFSRRARLIVFGGVAPDCCSETESYAGIWLARSRDGRHRRRITHGLDTSPSWSAGGRIVFERENESGALSELRVYSKGNSRRLTEGAQPAWSVTGWIAFVDQGSIWIIRPDGSDKRRVIAGSTPKWSPNGKRLAFLRPRGGIATVRANTSDARRLTAAGHDPVFSPDGRWIAFSRGAKLCTMRSRGGRNRCVTRVEEDLEVSDWARL